MKYENANEVLPLELINLIQEYTDGQYLYIPRKSENKKSWGEKSGFKKELAKRNKEIMTRYNQGDSIKIIASHYYLTEHSVRRIIKTYNQ